MKSTDHILTINGGSSSIKFALYQIGKPLKRGLYGKVDRIGLSGTNLTFHEPTKKYRFNLQPALPSRDQSFCTRRACERAACTKNSRFALVISRTIA
jgi:acetate kinase